MNRKTGWILGLGLSVFVLALVGVCLPVSATPMIFETADCTDLARIASPEEDTYFENARYSRKQSRDEAISVLKGILNNSRSDEATVRAAAAEISGYAARTEMEAQIENRILAKGFSSCIAFVSKETVSIVVKTEGLTREQSAQILEVAVAETGYSADSVKIIELK